MVIIDINFVVEIVSQILHAKFQDIRTSASGKDFKGFYHI